MVMDSALDGDTRVKNPPPVVATVEDIVNKSLVDWANLGMIMQALHES